LVSFSFWVFSIHFRLVSEKTQGKNSIVHFLSLSLPCLNLYGLHVIFGFWLIWI